MQPHRLHHSLDSLQCTRKAFESDCGLSKATEREDAVAHDERVGLMGSDTGDDGQDCRKPHIRKVRLLTMEDVLDHGSEALLLVQDQLPEADGVNGLACVQRYILYRIHVNACRAVNSVFADFGRRHQLLLERGHRACADAIQNIRAHDSVFEMLRQEHRETSVGRLF